MNEIDTNESEVQLLEEYKNLETRLYGELIKSCRRYSNKLNVISILGILELVKQEIKDLDKTHKKFMKDQLSAETESMERMI